MKMETRYFIILFFAIIIACFFYSPLISLIRPFVRLFYEGTSYGKSYAFLLWFVLLFLVFSLKEKLRLNSSRESFFNPFAKLVLFGYLLAIFSHIFLFFNYSGTFPGPFDIVAAMSSEDNKAVWEASYFGHIHSNKVSLFFLDYLPFDLAADNGLPLFNAMPFSIFFSAAVLLLVLFLIIFALLEILLNEKIFSIKAVFWAIASWGAIVTVVDGGPFTPAGQFSITMLAFYYFFFCRKLNTKPFLNAFFLFFAILFASSALSASLPTYGFSLAFSISSIVLLQKAANFRDKLAFLLLSVAFALLVLIQAGGIIFGNELENGAKATFFVYGIPLDTSKEKFYSLASAKFQDANIYLNGYIAIISGTLAERTSESSLSSYLKQGLNAKSYLEAISMGQKKQKMVFSSRSQELGLLTNCNSPYFSATTSEGNLIAESTIPYPYSALYALNCLSGNGIKNPVLVIRNYYI